MTTAPPVTPAKAGVPLLGSALGRRSGTLAFARVTVGQLAVGRR